MIHHQMWGPLFAKAPKVHQISQWLNQTWHLYIYITSNKVYHSGTPINENCQNHI